MNNNMFRAHYDRTTGGLKRALSDPEFRETYIKSWEVFTSFVSSRTTWDGLQCRIVPYVDGVNVLRVMEDEDVGLLPIPLFMELIR